MKEFFSESDHGSIFNEDTRNEFGSFFGFVFFVKSAGIMKRNDKL